MSEAIGALFNVPRRGRGEALHQFGAADLAGVIKQSPLKQNDYMRNTGRLNQHVERLIAFKDLPFADPRCADKQNRARAALLPMSDRIAREENVLGYRIGGDQSVGICAALRPIEVDHDRSSPTAKKSASFRLSPGYSQC